MSTKRNVRSTDALPHASAADRAENRWQVLLRGALLGWVLARLVGTLLHAELRALQLFFVPLSALAGGCAALGAWSYFSGLPAGAARRWRSRTASAALGFGVLLLLMLYARFVVRLDDVHGKSVAFLVGGSRSATCNCSLTAANGACIQSLGFDLAANRSCWSDRWMVEVALALSYLWTLASIGVLVGVLKAPPGSAPQLRPYLDFDLWIDERANSTYRAKAWSAGAGFEATVDFTLPPAIENQAPFRFGFADANRGSPGADETVSLSPEEVGEELFRAVFQGALLKSFLGCLEEASGGPGLRIRLRLNDAPKLACLPWEYLNDAKGRGFLALSSHTPVVRYLELSESLGTLRIEPPLAVLVVIATPSGYEDLAQADEEWRRLGEALKPLLKRRQIQLERLASPTFAALTERLRDGLPLHVLHFVGHGGFSDLRGEGVLVFEDDEGKGDPIFARSLAYLVQDHASLRLAVLNACNGARASHEDAFAGTAQILVQHGVPAVVAMQAEVTDATACRFSEEFYQALATGQPIDSCVGEVRRVLAKEGNPEWGTPVVYLRAADGRLFAVERRQE